MDNSNSFVESQSAEQTAQSEQAASAEQTAQSEQSASAEQTAQSEQSAPAEQTAQSEQSAPAEQTERMGVIYKITNTLNGKPYIGKTKRKLSQRIYEHITSKKKTAVEDAIDLCGWSNFTLEVIEMCPIEKLDEREIFWIAKTDSKAPKGYNLTDGGDGNSNPSDETRAKMSANHADVSGEKNPMYGQKRSPETCAKIAAAHKGKPSPQKGTKRSPETCAKIAAAKKGKPSPRKGQKHTPESIAKMSAAKKGKPGTPHTEESKAKISAKLKGRPSPLKGRKLSPEVCARIAAGRKAAWARKKLESQNNS